MSPTRISPPYCPISIGSTTRTSSGSRSASGGIVPALTISVSIGASWNAAGTVSITRAYLTPLMSWPVLVLDGATPPGAAAV